MFRSGAALLLATAALLALAPVLDGCTYLRYVSVQSGYRDGHAAEPRRRLAKHFLDEDSYFVYGRLLGDAAATGGAPVAIAALSSHHQPDEIVEITQLGTPGKYYGMNLPDGEYRLLALADLNRDGVFDQREVVAERRLVLEAGSYPTKVAGGIDLELAVARELPVATLPAPVAPDSAPRPESLFYPKGTLRRLEDPLFSQRMGELGLYDPAAFMEAAPMMFYALEEDLGYKIPVVFVHGIGGSAREFEAIIARLDRTRYKAWFFHYPSGAGLDRVARLFHDLFLSGTVIPNAEMPMIIVAHSMGGLVVREAMNLGSGASGEIRVALLITLASPFGGHPAAKLGVERAPMVVPAWRDLDPGSAFVRALFRKPLPAGTAHHLLYTYRSADDPDDPRAGDGVVPLWSQLATPARAQAAARYGFRTGHTEILGDSIAIERVIGLVSSVKGPLPEEHLRYLLMGGFDVPLGGIWNEREQFFLKAYGRYMQAMANGELDPVHPAQHSFIDAARGVASPADEMSAAWLKFAKEYPGLAGSAAPRPPGTR
jgi:pimeloyl-ACP methyl ester carboxylesterase